jgi:hypothetical protein
MALRPQHFIAVLPLAASLLATRADAFTTTALAAGYSAAPFNSMAVDTGALAFSAGGSAYVSPRPAGSPIVIEDALSPFTTFTVVSTYTNTGSMGPSSSVNGLDFSSTGKLYASEGLASGNAGYIREVATGAELATLPSFRPTGIAVADDNTFYFTGRQASNLSFGGVYRATRGGSVVQVIPDIIGRGIARNAAGDLFVSTPSTPVTAGYLGGSIYKFVGGSSPGHFVATFDGNGPAELTQDGAGKIYALGDPVNSSSPVIVLTATASAPAVSAWGNFAIGSLLGMAGLVMLKRRTKTPTPILV